MRTTFAAAYAELARSQKPPAGVSLYTRYVNRPLGRAAAAAAAALGVAPNLVTAVSGVLIVGAVVVLTLPRPGPGSAVGVSALLVGSFVLDSADGQLARLQGGGSAPGEWLDHVIDAGKGVCVHAGVLVAAYRFFDVTTRWLLVPLAFQLLTVLVYSGGTLRDLIGRTEGLQRPARTVGRRASAVVLLPADSGVLGLMFLTLAHPALFVVVYSVFLFANVLIGGLLMGKWYRELAGSSRARSPLPGPADGGL